MLFHVKEHSYSSINWELRSAKTFLPEDKDTVLELIKTYKTYDFSMEKNRIRVFSSLNFL